MSKLLDGLSVLVTGGTGSLGKALVAAILEGRFGNPERVLVFSRDEAKQHDMRMEFLNRRSATDDLIYQDHSNTLRFRIGDVRSQTDLSRAIDGIDIVIHAAALKQVPSCEYFPEQALETNCVGTINLIEALRTTPNRVRTVVGLSTDKACEPTNVMGMTKALQERLLIAANLNGDRTRFVAVRYGNIVASRGSVIPLFMEQIRLGKPLTLTSQKMTRFMMPVDAAVETIIEALVSALPGEIVVRSAPSVLIRDVIDALLGERQLPVKITGMRPGEKLHEILISHEEAHRAARIGDFIYLTPMLPEFSARREVTPANGLPGALSSSSNVLGLAETRALFERWQIAKLAAASL